MPRKMGVSVIYSYVTARFETSLEIEWDLLIPDQRVLHETHFRNKNMGAPLS